MNDETVDELRKHYVYELRAPNPPYDVFYVGKGVGESPTTQHHIAEH